MIDSLLGSMVGGGYVVVDSALVGMVGGVVDGVLCGDVDDDVVGALGGVAKV